MKFARTLLLALFAISALTAADDRFPIGPGPIPVAGTVFSNGTGLTSTQIGYGDTNNKVAGAPGFIVVGTPSATAPSAGTNGPGLLAGVVSQGADGVNNNATVVAFANSTGAIGSQFQGYACQGTAASPGATGTSDTCKLVLRGHDGTNYTGAQAQVGMFAGSAWTPTSRETFLTLSTTPNASTTLTPACRIDSNQTLCWGGSFNSVGTFSAGALRPHIQTSSTSAANVGIAQVIWNNNAVGPTGILAKSRSLTVGTQGIVTAGDTAGTMSWQLDDGANFIAAAEIKVVQSGTPALTRMGGSMQLRTGTDAAPTVMTTAETISNTQTVTWNGTTEASSATVANCVDSGGLAVAKRSFLGTIATTYSGNVVAGVQDATAVVAGQVGEVLTGAQSTPTNFTTTATIQNLTSIALTRGDWLETATFTLAMNGATEVASAEAACYLNDTTASATGAVEGETIGYVYEPASTSSVHATVTIIYHENISSPKTKFLNAKAVWTAGTPQYTCSMKAVRIR